MDLAARIEGFFSTYNALLDLGRNKLPFYQGIEDSRIKLLVEKGYLVPGTTRVHCLGSTPSVVVEITHYKRTPKGQRDLWFAQIPNKIINLPNAVACEIYDFLHPD